MALNIYVRLTAGGNEIVGETTSEMMGSVDVSGSIEAMALYHEVSIPLDAGKTGGVRATTHRQHGPITIVKRIDRSTPLLLDAWVKNSAVDGEVKFFRAHRDTGAMEQHYKITIAGGRISSVRTEMLNNNFAEGGAVPVMERVSIIYNTIVWDYGADAGSTQANDSWQSVV